MMEELLSRGALIDVIDKIGWRPLSYACANNRSGAVEKLLEWGSKLNVINEDNSPFHIAAAMGHLVIVKMLLEKGANIRCQNKKCQSPIDIACENNHYEVVSILMSASTKKVEETSKSKFDNEMNNSKSRLQMGMGSLSCAKSTSNIASRVSFNLSPSWLDDSPNANELNRCTSGSQERISITDRGSLQTMRSHPAKKSGSLNAIFVQDYEPIKNSNQPRIIVKKSLKGSKTNIKIPQSENEFQYTPKPSPSELFKIKSPLLPFTNGLRKDHESTEKYTSTECANYFTPSTVKLVAHKNPVLEISDDQSHNGNELFKLRNPQFKSKIISGKIVRSSLPVQSNCYSGSKSTNTCFFSDSNDFLNSEKSSERQLFDFGNIDVKDRHVNIRKPIQNRDLNRCIDNFQISSNHNADEISCHTWIESIGLSKIWNTLVDEGFESFLALSLADDDDLFILCNSQSQLYDSLKTNLKNLNIPPLNQLVFSSEILQVLTQLGLGEYSSNFLESGYHLIHDLPKINEIFFNQLGIVKIGHRKLLMSCLEIHQQPRIVKSTFVEDDILNLSPEPSKDLSGLSSPYNSSIDISSKSNSIKRQPPPIPPRSWSIPNDKSNNDETPINIDPKPILIMNETIEYGKSNDLEEELAHLDDMVAMLADLGRELDNEITNGQ